MNTKVTQAQAAVMLGIAVFATVAYLNFINFKPTGVATDQAQVKGKSTLNGLGIPYPDDAVEISSGHAASGYQITLSVKNVSPEQIQEFYKNVFGSRNWEVESQGEAGVFLSTKYKTKESNERVTITSYKQEKLETTVVIIDIS